MQRLPDKVRFWAPLWLIIVIHVLVTPESLAQAEHEKLITAAWKAFTASPPDYPDAITNAQKCVDGFKEAAEDAQANLEKAGTKLPTGAVSDEVKRSIHVNGPLNDVATGYFIIGEANMALGKTDPERIKAAKLAYEEARKLTLGRCWDPNGWFWSPAETAAQRLRRLPTVPRTSR